MNIKQAVIELERMMEGPEKLDPDTPLVLDMWPSGLYVVQSLEVVTGENNKKAVEVKG